MDAIGAKTVEGLLTLTALKGVGPAYAERLAASFSDLDAIVKADPDQLRHVVPRTVAATLHRPAEITSAVGTARRVLEQAGRQGVRIISVFDQNYPAPLRLLDDRPLLLFVKGTLPPLRSVACIGTREPSEFGALVCDRLVESLVQANWTIVSGLAIGIDTRSHQAALRHKGRTVAVLGGGLDSIHPRQNARLAEEILEQDGALISEQPFGVLPSARTLVPRDRIQSGLSVGTFVMQTDIEGGSMHTVRFTIRQNRLLFAPVPQGRHAREAKSQGILAMTQMTGPCFAGAVQAKGEYRRILLERYSDRPVAVPLASKEDYPSMLSRLDACLTMPRERMPTPSAEPAAVPVSMF